MKYIIKLNYKTWSMIIMTISIVSLTIRYTLMGDKFFADSIQLMSIEQSGIFSIGSFDVAALFFCYINFFDIGTLMGWSIYITIIYFFINVWILKDVKIVTIYGFCFIILSFFLWYLFVAGITKEILQGIFYLLIYCVCKGDLNNKIKLFLGTTVLLGSAIVFREYYLLTAYFSVTTYIAIHIIRKFFGKTIKFYSLFLVIIFMIMVFLLTTEILFPQEYVQIVTLRSSRYLYLEGYTDSLIKNIIDGDNFNIMIYIFNYIIIFFRLIIPLELLVNSKIYYIPFIVYQIMFTVNYFKELNECFNNSALLEVVFITSFLIVSAMMEPDFGSWARHQCVLIPISVSAYIKQKYSC